MASLVHVRTMAVASHRFMAHHGTDAPRAGATLELGDRIAEPGGFGTVYPVRAVDGVVPRRGLAAKVYDPAVVGAGDGIVTSTQRLIAALESQNPAGWEDRLLALPFWLAHVEVDGQAHLVALMLDLTVLGYEPCSFDGGDDVAHRARPLTDRLRIAETFASTFEIFELIHYVHSDVNPENCLINFATGDTQIIDLDAGVVLETGAERPLSEGKPDEFLPPELRFATMNPNVVGSANPYTLQAERWSLGAMVGYLIFAAFPGFYLVNLSPLTLTAYAQSPAAWPDIDRSGVLFTRIAQNQQRYDELRAEFLALPNSVGDLFRRFFRAATNGADRPTAAEWKQGLLDLQAPPELLAFVVTPAVAADGEIVELSWLATNTSFVAIDGLVGRLAPTGTTRFIATASMDFTITLTNPYSSLTLPAGRLDVIDPAPPLLINEPAMLRFSNPRMTHPVSPSRVAPIMTWNDFALVRKRVLGSRDVHPPTGSIERRLVMSSAPLDRSSTVTGWPALSVRSPRRAS